MAKYKATLSQQSIADLKKQIAAYQNDLPNKCRELASELLKLGIVVSQAQIDKSPLGKYVTLKTNISHTKAGCKAVLIAIGEVKQPHDEKFEPFNTLLAIEFGAGIYHNPTPNPNADKFGLGVGTYPGQIHAFDDGWYYWDDKSQSWKYTHGVKATMPMYNADVKMIKSVVSTARKVFGK